MSQTPWMKICVKLYLGPKCIAQLQQEDLRRVGHLLGEISFIFGCQISTYVPTHWFRLDVFFGPMERPTRFHFNPSQIVDEEIRTRSCSIEFLARIIMCIDDVRLYSVEFYSTDFYVRTILKPYQFFRNMEYLIWLIPPWTSIRSSRSLPETIEGVSSFIHSL